jgi:membrane protein
MMQEIIEEFKNKTIGIYNRANQKTGRRLGILVEAFTNFNEARAGEAAASMAYYTLFSLFPLLLALIYIGSFFLESERVQVQVLDLVRTVIPVSPGLIIDNIQEVLEIRASFGIIGAMGLIWAGSAAFMILFRNINRAWQRAEPMGVIKSRLWAVAFIVAVVVLLIVIRFASAIINLLPELAEIIGREGYLRETPLWLVISNGVPLLLTFLLFFSLYYWIPNTKVRGNEAFWAALVAALGLEITTNAFTWFLSTGLVQYRVVYGSLGTMIALLFWIYLNNVIILFCAHLSAAIARKNRPYSEDVQPEIELAADPQVESRQSTLEEK